MRAIIQTEYGSTDMLSLKEVDKPVVPDNGVLVQVQAASVNSGILLHTLSALCLGGHPFHKS
jgi:NADPH:quinone reductase-like Zn-dependent oxidoreductase